MTKPANQIQENEYVHHIDRPILAFSHSGISESSNQFSPTAAGIQTHSENPGGPVGHPDYFGVAVQSQPKSNPAREIANKETTITEKTSHTPNTQMLIKGDGGSSGKLNTQLKMKRVPSSQKMDKSKRPKLQTHVNNTNFGADDLHSQKSQSKSRDRGTAANHANGLIPQQYMAQQQIMSVHQAELATNGLQTYVGEPEMVQNFNFVQMGNNQPPFAFSNMTGPQMQLQQWQGQQPQVHFIANKQKFYGISPERAPIIFTQPGAQNIQAAIQNSEKRPYTVNTHPKRSQTGTNVKNNNNSAVAAMYMGMKTHQQGFNYNPAAQVRNASQPNNSEVSQLGYQNPSVQQTLSMLQFPSKRQQVTVHNRAQIQASSANNANRKTNPIVSKESEQLYEEVLRLKQQNNQTKEEAVKLKTKIKILEAENARKERAIEDFCTQNQFISQAQKNPQLNGQLAPIAQTAQRYQQETYLVMSLKKQIKEIKFELMKKEEEMYNLKKNIKTSRLIEVEYELAAYKEELVRLRFMLENNMQNLAHHASLTSQQTANELQPSVTGKFQIQSSYSDVIRPDQLSHGQSQGASQEFSSMRKREEVMTKQTENNMPASLGATHTSGFNIFNSIQDGNAAKVHDDIIAHLNQQLQERDMQIQQLQGIVDEMMLVKDSKVESTSKIEARGVDPEEEKKQKQDIAKLKKLVQAKEKENVKAKGEVTLLTQKTAQMEEELAKLKQQSQVSTKKQKDLQAELKTKTERIDQLVKDLQSATDAAKTTAEKGKQQVQEIKNLQQNLQELHNELETVKQSRQNDAHKSIDKIEKISTKPDSKLEGADAISRADAEEDRKERERTKLLIMRENVFDELNIVCAIIGRKEDLDRVDITHLLKAHSEVSYLECSLELVDFIETCSTEQLAPLIPRYTLGSEERDRQNMHRLRKIVAKKELFEILSEKEKEDCMPFDAIKELCEKFGFAFNDEQCGFICANFLRKIQRGAVFIDFAAFLGALKSDKDKSVLRDTSDVEDGATKTLMTVTADESEIEKATLEGAEKVGKKPVKGKKNLSEEQMLDIAEGCFIKMAELLLIKGRSVRNVFTKYSVPEIFPDRTVLELLSPLSLLEGIKEIGLDDLEEVEAACLMRVLAKPELDNAIILNELVLIMENFGVPDGDEDAEDDYIPDTETDVSKMEEKEENKEDIQRAGLTQKSKKRVYDLKKIDAKGIKILKKLARFLLKQFLHPREFFGKAITKEKIKTKKREFVIDVIKVKDFYLRLKIASIRKRLTENVSLNDELCVDLKTHKDIFNVKQMVKALEEIAEEEQVLMMKEEALAKEKKMVELTEKAIKEEAEKKEEQMKLKVVEGESQIKSPEQSLTPTGIGVKPVEGQIEVGKHKTKKQDAPDYYMTGGTEVMRFGNHNAHNRRAGTSVALNTIEEENHETQTSNYYEGISEKDNSGMLNSNNFRYSKDAKEFEFDDDKKDDPKLSAARIPVNIFIKSLTHEDISKMSATNRSSDDRPENRDKSATATTNIDIQTAHRKKVSQSAVNDSHFRGSILNSEVFDSKSDSQETPQKPLQMQKQV